MVASKKKSLTSKKNNSKNNNNQQPHEYMHIITGSYNTSWIYACH